jgi:uroporphyrin-III C-methyltransferase
MKGRVFLVGAGPGDPELLTLKALRVLQAADVVLHDDLISDRILELIPPTAQVRNVGKRCGRKSVQQEEINAQMIAFATFGLNVVRLKGGDPLIFGRAGEEMAALRKANVAFEVIPGVTSALASAAAAGVSLTQRETSSAVVFLTSHHASVKEPGSWPGYVSSGATLAIYMPGFNFAETASQLRSAGMKADTACVLVSRAGYEDQRVHRTTVQNLPSAPRLQSPTLLLVGDAVGLRDTVEQHSERNWSRLQAQAFVPPPVVLDLFLDSQIFWGD